MPGSPKLHQLSCSQQPARAIADFLLDRCQPQLPDLSDVLILADPRLHGGIRRQLLLGCNAAGVNAVLAPRLLSLPQWLDEQQPLIDDLSLVSPGRRELILIRELREAKQLYGSGNPWQLCIQLLQLFDELTLNQRPPEQDLQEFLSVLGDAYQIPAPVAGLEQEARLVHSLWQAWQEHQHQHHQQDASSRYLSQLSDCHQAEPRPGLICLLGGPFKLAELSAIARLGQTAELHLFSQSAGLDPTILDSAGIRLLQICDHMDHRAKTSPLDNFYNQLFQTREQPLSMLCADLRQQMTSPPAGLPAIFRAIDNEQHAQAICNQCGLWLQQGVNDIGIVCEDRKLARRLRSLLDQRRVPVNDLSGWALSTTRSAAVLERWLEVIEQDFYHAPLLDLLKSPTLKLSQDQDIFLRIVFQFEHDIVRFSNIPRGIMHYRNTLHSRDPRGLKQIVTSDGVDLDNILDKLELAAAPLTKYQDDHRHDSATMIKALLKSMDILGISSGFGEDEAGCRILEELTLMQDAARDEAMVTDWTEFRTWLGFTLERYNFVPKGNRAPVTLMGLEHSDHRHFQGLLIAGAEARWFPGTGSGFSFFNDRVRRSLGLPDLSDQYLHRLYLFRRLLSAADRVVATLRTRDNGEEILPCPWLELVETAAGMAWNVDLNTTECLVEPIGAEQTTTSSADGPASPILEPSLVPDTLSATDLQTLMSCPYRFYAIRGLQLRAPEAVSEQLEKSDYGALVHRCLQAFHGGIKGLPGPFQGELNQQRLGEAESLLQDISRQVFGRLDQEFVNNSWLFLWQKIIPGYLRWQLAQGQEARFERAEESCLAEDEHSGIALKGRIDRLDHGESGLHIIDYKTGAIPTRKDLLAGNALQLPFYALLTEQSLNQTVDRVVYLKLEASKISSLALTGEPLEQLVAQLQACLKDTRDDLRQGSRMPAWGDQNVCKWCEFTGLCRKTLQDTGEVTVS